MASGTTSAGILLYRMSGGSVRVLIGHPGGPFWVRKNEGAWSIPKGIVEPDEDALATARREFEEETGCTPPLGEPIPLGEAVLRSGKRVVAWALEGDLDPGAAVSNPVEMEWPRGVPLGVARRRGDPAQSGSDSFPGSAPEIA